MSSALSDDDVIAEVDRHSGALDALAVTERFAKSRTRWSDVQNAIQRGLDKGRSVKGYGRRPTQVERRS